MFTENNKTNQWEIFGTQKRIFNYKLSRARKNIESSFGVFSNKWNIFHKPINIDLDLCKQLVQNCCVLHFFVRSRYFKIQLLFEIKQNTLSDRSINEKYNLADYFVSDFGSVLVDKLYNH